VIWNASGGPLGPGIAGVYAVGLLIVLASTVMIDHFDLFGLRQVYRYLLGRPQTQIAFRTPLLYRYVRHPLYVGWLLTFWAAPVMTVAHLFFALMTTAYILVAIRFEERDLVSVHGKRYERYREQVPMLIPSARTRVPDDGGASVAA
jgi:protein-S-isoprenylcysteine O-methyltransferase Ste14